MDNTTYGVKLYENEADNQYIFAYYKNGREVANRKISEEPYKVKEEFFRLINYISQDMCAAKLYGGKQSVFKPDEMLIFECKIKEAASNGIYFKEDLNLIGSYSGKRDGYCFYSPLRDANEPVFMGELYNAGTNEKACYEVRRLDFPEYKWASYEKLESMLNPDAMSDKTKKQFYEDKSFYFLFVEQNGFIYRAPGHVKVWAKDRFEALKLFFERMPGEKKWAIKEDEFSPYNITANFIRKDFPMSFDCIADENAYAKDYAKYARCIVEIKRGDKVYGYEENSYEEKDNEKA